MIQSVLKRMRKCCLCTLIFHSLKQLGKIAAFSSLPPPSSHPFLTLERRGQHEVATYSQVLYSLGRVMLRRLNQFPTLQNYCQRNTGWGCGEHRWGFFNHFGIQRQLPTPNPPPATTSRTSLLNFGFLHALEQRGWALADPECGCRVRTTRTNALWWIARSQVTVLVQALTLARN